MNSRNLLLIAAACCIVASAQANPFKIRLRAFKPPIGKIVNTKNAVKAAGFLGVKNKLSAAAWSVAKDQAVKSVKH